MVVCMCVCTRSGSSTAAAARLPHRSALDLQVGLVSSGCRSRAHALLDLSSHSHEGLLHIRGILSARLKEGDC